MRKLVPLLTLMALAACAKKPADLPAAEAAPPPPAATTNAPPGASDAASSAQASTEKPPAQPVAAPVISAPQLAYAFDYTFALPEDRIEGALNHDQEACLNAGPTVCQLVGSSLDRASEGVASAHLEVRATQGWIARFRAGAEAEAKATGGKIDGAQVQSEDLSRSIVDTEAAVRAKTALRDRLQQLLAERPGKLSDVMDVQHELTQAQADLDATTSELAVMRTRVAMSKLTIAYNAEGANAPNGPWRPVRQAASHFLGNAAGVLAALVSLFSVLLPLGLVIGPLIWLAIWFAGRNRRRRPTRPATPSA